MLPNIVSKMNYVSSQGTWSKAAPAVQRGEEPLDYNALVKLKIGDIVLGYNDSDTDRTKAVFMVVLDHTFDHNPHITSGFNLETNQNTSAGNVKCAKFTKPNVKDIPSFIKTKLKELLFKGSVECRDKVKKQKRDKEFLVRRVSQCPDPSQRKSLEQELKEVPKNIDEVLVDVSKEIQELQSKGGSSTVEAAAVPSSIEPTMEGESQANPAANGPEPPSDTIETPVVDEPEISVAAAPEQISTKPSTAATPVAEQPKPYNFRKKHKAKSYNHLLLEELNNISPESRAYNYYVHTNVLLKKGGDLDKFLIFHTTISEALREDQEPVKEAIVREWSQVLDSSEDDKSVLKCMSPDFNVRGKTVIPSMMFMKKKMNKVTKKLEKWKARLAAGGHMQDADLYPKKDITVPTLDHSALLTFLSSMMKRKGVRFHAMDFPGAFLSADLETDVSADHPGCQ
jgi:hypothetical protein